MDYTCSCGGLFHLEYKKTPIDFDLLRTSQVRSIQRYSSSLPLFDEDITMKEGGTPLISLTSSLMGKADYFMPTLSFKDRGAVILVSMMKSMG